MIRRGWHVGRPLLDAHGTVDAVGSLVLCRATHVAEIQRVVVVIAATKAELKPLTVDLAANPLGDREHILGLRAPVMVGDDRLEGLLRTVTEDGQRGRVADVAAQRAQRKLWMVVEVDEIPQQESCITAGAKLRPRKTQVRRPAIHFIRAGGEADVTGRRPDQRFQQVPRGFGLLNGQRIDGDTEVRKRVASIS